jgi:hypothetical protein
MEGGTVRGWNTLGECRFKFERIKNTASGA